MDAWVHNMQLGENNTNNFITTEPNYRYMFMIVVLHLYIFCENLYIAYTTSNIEESKHSMYIDFNYYNPIENLTLENPQHTSSSNEYYSFS